MYDGIIATFAMAVNQVSKSARETGVSFTDYGQFFMYARAFYH